MENRARTRTKSKKPPARPELEPISYEEIMANAGMSGFVSFLDAPAPEAPVPASPAAPVSERGELAGQPSRPTFHAPATSQSATVSEVATVEQTDTVQERKTATVQQSNAVQQSNSVQESYTVQADGAHDRRRSRVKLAHAVEDGHSLAEQEIYRTLWKVGVPEGYDPEANRVVRIGYDRLAALVRLSWVTVKANLRSLEKKLAIDVVAAEDSANREGKQYRVYSNPAIWARRQTAGLLWVRRSRGVELLTASTPTEALPFPHRT
jgi:hypothetical protein